MSEPIRIKIQKLMNEPRNVRNIGVIAHVDHGKTTLTDWILLGARRISPERAGKSLILDYEEVEKIRKMTVKAAYASLPINYNEGLLVNLIDTPGHVDFSGYVDSSLRAVDGVICVVDAVEGVMAQTETSLYTAIKELVKPVLFINKVDRLIKELKFPKKKILDRIIDIINSFNALIEKFGGPEAFKLSFPKGTVLFGSALHGWAIDNSITQSGVRFEEIVKFYEKNQMEELRSLCPIQQALMRTIYEKLPSPLEAIKYRFQVICKNCSLRTKKLIKSGNKNGKLIAEVIGTDYSPSSGPRAVIRVFSGTIRHGIETVALPSNRRGRIQIVGTYLASKWIKLDSIPPGNIGVVSGIGTLHLGETLTSDDGERIDALSEIKLGVQPVVMVTVEPERIKDFEKLPAILNEITYKMPGLRYEMDKESGEIRLFGTGILQTEIATYRLRKRGLEVNVHEPTVIYRESALEESEVTYKSPNGRNTVRIMILPLYNSEGHSIPNIKEYVKSRTRTNLRLAYSDFLYTNFLFVRDQLKIDESDLKAFIEGFKFACKNGPLVGEHISHLAAVINEFTPSSTAEERDYGQLMLMVKEGIHKGILKGGVFILEPYYRFTVVTDPKFIDGISKILASRSGNIVDIKISREKAYIYGFIPVAESLDIGEKLRNLTHGRVILNLSFDSWKKASKKRMERIIKNLREKRGI